MRAAQLRNPVLGGRLRRRDHWGEGHFGAPRGERTHQGVDITATAGVPVCAPIHGIVVRIAEPYDDDPVLSGLLIQGVGPHADVAVKLFYLSPDISLLGCRVAAGTPIGISQSLQHRYPGITDHVHLELWRGNNRIDPTPLITEII